jgi:predicted ATPase
MGRGASGARKGAETREQRTRSDLERTGHGESLFTAAENRFWGSEQFGGSSE